MSMKYWPQNVGCRFLSSDVNCVYFGSKCCMNWKNKKNNISGSCVQKYIERNTLKRQIFKSITIVLKKYPGFLRHGKIEMPKIGKVEEKRMGV